MEKLSKAVSVLKKGGVVICPTDTVYGFLADASNKKAVEKIYKIKKRPTSKPLPVFVCDMNMAHKLAHIDERQEKMLRTFWPGKYTFVLKRKPVKLYGVDKKTIALRIPKQAFLQTLLKKVHKPLVQTSVNISAQEPLKSAQAIFEVFGKNRLVELIIDAGVAKKGKSSKVMDITTHTIKTLRT